MCGIAGLFDLNGKREFSRELLQTINDIQQHRGPDEAGLHLEPGAAAAIRAGGVHLHQQRTVHLRAAP